MPRRNDIRSILVIGSGPIIIGQGCEFDYSGTQAVKVLREEGYRVILVNSNPATIMTDPEFADATYVEPITADVVAAIIERERPDALLPTLGGQTALNVTMQLAERSVLDKFGVELIGAGLDAIEAAEDRGRFKEIMDGIGLETARAAYVRTFDDALDAAADLGYPIMVRPSYILGGGGTGIAESEERLRMIVEAGLDASPIGEVLIEESVVGWKEYELEVMRDIADNAVIVCSIENLDPMGVHTGDSITVAPTMTLSDREYQAMRDDAIACLRAIGVETGGSKVQFAVDPGSGRRIVIEMNPRVSRSSALASKATGFPIAKIAAKLAVGYTLDEITNDITGATPASFEPALDYVVVKVPRFDFAKFPSVEARLGTSMQSVGEAMAIGRTFPEALQKALRSLETGRASTAIPARPTFSRSTSRLCRMPWRRRLPSASTPWRRRCAEGAPWPTWRLRPASTLGSSARWLRSSICAAPWRRRLQTVNSHVEPAAWVSAKPSLRTSGGPISPTFAADSANGESPRPSRRWTRARRNSRPQRRISTAPTRTNPKRPSRRRTRSSFWDRVPTGSVRASSSTIAVSTPRLRCAMRGTRR